MGKIGKVIASAAVGALATAFSGGLAAFTAAAFFKSFAVSLVLGGLSMALSPKTPKSGNDPAYSLENKGQTVAVKQPDISRQHVFGSTRITRGFAHLTSTDSNKNFHMILILTEGAITGIREVWVNDYCIPDDWIDENGKVTQGRYANVLTIRKHLGTETQAADSLAVTNIPEWTEDHRMQGIAYLYIILNSSQDAYPNGIPNFSAVIDGKKVYDPRIDEDVFTGNLALIAANFLRNNEYGYSVFQDDIDYTNIAAQASICDEIVTVLDEQFEVKSVNETLNVVTLSGEYLNLIMGDRVVVSGTLPDGLSEGVDYYVIPYQILGTPRIGFATSLQNAYDRQFIDIGSGTTFNITKNGEPRYHGAGVIDTESTLSNTLHDIVSSMAGRAINIGGFWTLQAGAWRTPTVEFDENDVRGAGPAIKTDLTIGESYNIIKGIFVSQLSQYQSTDYPAAIYQQFINDDAGIESPKELNLAFCNRPNAAQRIAKIELFKGRQGIVVTSQFSLKAMAVQPGDNIMLTIDRFGWDRKYFEVTEFGFSEQNGALLTNLVLRETAQQIYDWSAGEAIGYDPAPNTNLTNIYNVAAPSGVGYDSRKVSTSDADTLFIVRLQWNPHPDAFVQSYGEFEIQFKLSSDIDWSPSFKVSGTQTFTDVMSASVDTYYDVRIRAINNLGVRSAWVTVFSVRVGQSGGVFETRDYGQVADGVDQIIDYGQVVDGIDPDLSEDFGDV